MLQISSAFLKFHDFNKISHKFLVNPTKNLSFFIRFRQSSKKVGPLKKSRKQTVTNEFFSVII